MSTLTVDGSDTPQELNADEQDPLAVGEELQQEQEQLLAGKYKSAEDLESAYLELQKKLGESQPSEEVQQKKLQKNLKPLRNILDALWNESQSEYTQETLKQLESMGARDLAQMHLEYRSKHSSEPKEFNEQTVQQLQSMSAVLITIPRWLSGLLVTSALKRLICSMLLWIQVIHKQRTSLSTPLLNAIKTPLVLMEG